MFATLKNLWNRFLGAFAAWRSANEEAHRHAGGGDCCSSPSRIYASRRGEADDPPGG